MVEEPTPAIAEQGQHLLVPKSAKVRADVSSQIGIGGVEWFTHDFFAQPGLEQSSNCGNTGGKGGLRAKHLGKFTGARGCNSRNRSEASEQCSGMTWRFRPA